MTNPGGASPETYLLDGWDGVLFGASSGGISGLQDLTQAAVMAAKQALIEGNEVLSFVLGLIFEGLRNGIPLALAIIEGIIVKLFGLIPGFTTIEEALNAIGEVPFIADIVQAITGTVGGTLHDIEIWAASLGSDVSGAAAKLAALISGVGGTVIGDVSGAINAANEDIAELIDGVGGLVIDDVVGKIILIQQIIDGIANALGHPGTGHSILQLIAYVENIPATVITSVFGGPDLGADVQGFMTSLGSVWPKTFPFTFGVSTNTTLGSFVPQSQFQQLLDGLAGQTGAQVHHAVAAVQQVNATAQSQLSQLILDGVNDVGPAIGGGVFGAISGTIGAGESILATAGTNAQSAVAQLVDATENAIGGAGAATTAFGQAIGTVHDNATDAVGQLEDAAVNVFGGAGAAVGQLGQQVETFFGGLFGAWTNGPTAAANAAAVNQAAAAAAAAAAFQAQQTAAIASQLPHFYGGSGTSGLNVNVAFSSALPASFTAAASIAANSAIYNVATASTDQETVSAFWNTSLAAAFTVAGGASQPNFVGPARYLFLRSSTALTTYLYVKFWMQNNFGGTPTARIEIGCVVAGVQHVLTTDILTSGPFAVSILNGSQAWSLEATGNAGAAAAIMVNGPGGYSLSCTDSTPVSQSGASYRSAGIGSDETSWLSNITDWNFYDSGPTAGPATAAVTTPETTASGTYVDLATATDQVTVNIGASGLAMVFINARISNDTAAAAGWVGVALSGANTAAADDSRAILFTSASANLGGGLGAPFLMAGLTPGATTFKLKYRVNAGTGTFQYRDISVIPL